MAGDINREGQQFPHPNPTVVGPGTQTPPTTKVMFSDLVNQFVFPVVYKDTSVNQFVFNTGKTLRVHKDCVVPVNTIMDVEWVAFRGGFKSKDGHIYVYKHGQFIKYEFDQDIYIYFNPEHTSIVDAFKRRVNADSPPDTRLQEAITMLFRIKIKDPDMSIKDIFKMIAEKINERNVTKWIKKFDRFLAYLSATLGNPLSDAIPIEEFLE